MQRILTQVTHVLLHNITNIFHLLSENAPFGIFVVNMFILFKEFLMFTHILMYTYATNSFRPVPTGEFTEKE